VLVLVLVVVVVVVVVVVSNTSKLTLGCLHRGVSLHLK
jgi:hypothetical protein